MPNGASNKKKIINDPVYGFITIRSDLIYDIINLPVFQRLRRIKQLGLTDFVYPGAIHTRFHHALGAMYLMEQALITLRSKGIEISDEEYEAALIAILLHDIGHGPFSHTLEYALLQSVSHEELSLVLMKKVNDQLNGSLDLAVSVFNGSYDRKFFNQLVASQLDMDRLDYLNRDSFFTGVSEGTVGVTRIIKMLQVRNDELLVEEKGIYSIESFLNARRLMYWQVYLHKATVSAEKMLNNLIQRSKWLLKNGHQLACPEPLQYLLESSEINIHSEEFYTHFTDLDDTDIWSAMKLWSRNRDFTLAWLSKQLLSRKLNAIQLSYQKFDDQLINHLSQSIKTTFNINDSELPYFYSKGALVNAIYKPSYQNINILTREGAVKELSEVSDLPNMESLGKIVKKYYLCYPKNISL